MAVSMPSIALIFKVLLNPSVGFVNYALGLDVGWYTDRHTAMAGILMLTVWMGIGFNYLLFLSAFRGIPEDMLDSAELDGAGKFRTILFKIQLPLISPTMLYVVCTNMIQAMMTSGPILILTQGGPSRSTTTLIYLMYTAGYRSSNYSLAACVSIIAFLLTLTFTLLLFMTERGGCITNETIRKRRTWRRHLAWRLRRSSFSRCFTAFAAPLNPRRSLRRGRPPCCPGPLANLDNFRGVLSQVPMLRYFSNSLAVATLSHRCAPGPGRVGGLCLRLF